MQVYRHHLHLAICFPKLTVFLRSFAAGKIKFPQIFENNKKWVEQHLQEDENYFKNLSVGQSPQFLLIGCSDSRVPSQEIFGLKAGELFVHRNLANMVVNSDLNMLSVLQYSVEVLKVQDIIVMGHYFCQGVKASTRSKDHGLLEHWLRNIRDVSRMHAAELRSIEDDEERGRRLVELNIQEQCINLFANPIVQKSQTLTGLPYIHGFVYDISEGLLKELPIDLKTKLKPIYDVYTMYDVASRKRKSPKEVNGWISEGDEL